MVCGHHAAKLRTGLKRMSNSQTVPDLMEKDREIPGAGPRINVAHVKPILRSVRHPGSANDTHSVITCCQTGWTGFLVCAVSIGREGQVADRRIAIQRLDVINFLDGSEFMEERVVFCRFVFVLCKIVGQVCLIQFLNMDERVNIGIVTARDCGHDALLR